MVNALTAKIKILAALALSFGALGLAHSATIVNKDEQARTLVVTEGGSKSELSLAAGETTDFCPSGCFVTMPNGDREALIGTETIEIRDGVGRVRQ